MWLGIGLLALAGAFVWLMGRSRHGSRRHAGDTIERDVLEEAEREVRDLDAMTSPDDADQELPDWGPGAPRS
ncbi:MAG: hypothetical protein V3T28_01360 [Gemmatimonadales bacterium]